MSRRRAFVFTMAAVLAATGLVWVPATGQWVVRAATATTTTLDMGPQPVVHGAVGGLVATVSPVPTVFAQVFLYRVDSGLHQFVSRGAIHADGTVSLSLDTPYVAGHYLVRAEFQGTPDLIESQSPDMDLEIVRVSLSVSLTVDDTTPSFGQSVTLTAAVSDFTSSLVTFTDRLNGGEPTVIGAGSADPFNGQFVTVISTTSLGVGANEITAFVAETSTTEPATSPALTIDVGRIAVVVQFEECCPKFPNEPSTFVANVLLASDHSGPLPDATGSMSFSIDGSPVGTKVVVAGTATFDVASFTVGPHSLTVTYSGDPRYVSAVLDGLFEIFPDSVKVTGVGRNYSTFYPVKDKYRDAVAIRGNRGEPISASIKVYSSKGKLVRAASVARGVGWYAYAWNGRTASGKLLPAGRYRVVQTLTDELGTKQAFASFVTLSHKRIVTRTVTLTKTVSQASKRTSSWAGWKFTMPKATVYLGLRAYVRGQSVMIPGGDFGGHDVTACPITSWYPGCATRIGDIGHTLKWYSRKLSASKDHSGRTVKIYAWADYGGSVGITHARLKVSYGVLR